MEKNVNNPKMEEDAKKNIRRPMNAFLIFCKRHRSKERAKNPDLDNRSITRLLGDKWAKLSPQEKSYYINLARENKEAFLKIHPNYKWRKTEKRQSSKSSANTVPGSSGKAGSKGSRKTKRSAKSKSNTGGVNLLLMADKQSSDECQKKSSSATRQNASSSSRAAPSGKSTSAGKRGASAAAKQPKQPSAPVPVADSSHYALLQLAEMCTSELYSSVPNKANNNTTTTPPSPHSRMSSPLPPPKKRARQWSLDCSQEAMDRESQKSDSQGSSKHSSNPKKPESSSAQRKQKNTSKNVQPSSPSESETSHTSWKPDRKSKDIYAQRLGSPPLSGAESKPPLFLSKEHFSPASIPPGEDICSAPLRAEAQQLPGRPPPHLFPSPLTQTSAHSTRDSEPWSHGHRPHPDHSWRDLPETALDFSKTSDKRLDNNAKFVHDRKESNLPSRSEGTIASLLSSPFPFSKYDTSSLKPEVVDSKANIASGVSVTSQPSEKLPVTDAGQSPISCSRDINVPSGSTTQPFTEGKLKKKWTQRMMVETMKKEDIARQIAGGVETSRPPFLDPLGPAAPLKTESTESQNTSPAAPADKMTPFHPFCKTEIKSEPFSNSHGSQFSKSAVYNNNQHVFSSNSASSSPLSSSSSSYNYGKSEPLQSNTLYRALMGQAPSPLCLSSYSSNHPPSNSFNNNHNSENSSLKLEDDKKVFTPIAACGKKMMDHIRELFQSGFSGDPNCPEPGHRPVQMVDRAFTHMSDLSTVSVDLPQSLKGSVADGQGSLLSLTGTSPNSLMERVVTEECSRRLTSFEKMEIDMKSSAGRGCDSPCWKGANTQPPGLDGVKKENHGTNANVQNELLPDASEDLNTVAELPEDLTAQPVRKSRRANRGQKYQALIKEGIIQPSKERMAARNMERNIRSLSSRDDLEKVEPKKALKRSYNEREAAAVAGECDPQVAAVPVDRQSPVLAKNMCLDKENVSNATRSGPGDQSDKKKTTSLRSQLESTMTAPKPNAVQSQSSKGVGLSEAPKKDVNTGKLTNSKPASCNPSLQELGCHTVHIPIVQEERLPESLTGSRKRKARRHCITRISVAPPKGKVEAKNETILPSMIPEFKDKELTEDNRNMSATGGKQDISVKYDLDEGMKKSVTLPPQGIPLPRNSPPTALLQHGRQNPHIHTNFPALTLLSSVMIDSEKAVSPACQNEAPSTTQSPTPASLARPWPTGVETTQLAASQSNLLPTSTPLAPSGGTPALTDPMQAAKWLMGVQATSLMPQSHAGQVFPSKGPLFADLQRSSESATAEMTTTAFCKSKLFDLSSTPALGQRATPQCPSWPLRETSSPQFSSVTSSSRPPPQNSSNVVPNNATSVNPAKRPLTSAGVLSPFVISTLPPSTTKVDSTSCTWSKSVAPSARAPARKRKSPKGVADEKIKPGVDSYPALTQKTLNPSTKKLVKLLLKGDSMEEPHSALKLSQEANIAASSQELGGAKHEMSGPASRPSEQMSPRRPTPKAAKTDAMAIPRGSSSSPLYLSLKSHLESGQGLPSDKNTEPLGVKKRKPTIWDHLNSPGCLPISTARNAPNAATKRGQERAPPMANQPTSQRSSRAPRAVKAADVNVKDPRKERNSSDTESASEDSAGHDSSDTDSAEELEPVPPSPSTTHENSSSSDPTVSNQKQSNRLPRPLSSTPSSSTSHGQSNSSSSPSSHPHPPPSTTSLSQLSPKSSSLFASISTTTTTPLFGLNARPSTNPVVGRPIGQTASNCVPSRAFPKSSDNQNAPLLKLPRLSSPTGDATSPLSTTVSPFQQAITMSATISPVSQPPGLNPVSVHAPVYLPVVVTSLEGHPSNQDTSRPGYNKQHGYSVSVAPHAPRIPSHTAFPPSLSSSSSSSSAGMDQVVYDARTTSPLMEGGTTRVSSAPHLPGSPSVAAVQS